MTVKQQKMYIDGQFVSHQGDKWIDVLNPATEEVIAREQALTDIIIAKGGKTRALANTEVLFTADYLDYMAEWARRYEGEIVQSDRRDENIFVFKKAIGVTTGILPWLRRRQ